jgi:DnaJ-class molecular chaperone
MAERLTTCAACDGLGYFRCGCWPGDCICGFDEETCDECGGEGIIDAFYSHDLDCTCPTCDGTGKEARHQLCRDCDEVDTSTANGSSPLEKERGE